MAELPPRDPKSGRGESSPAPPAMPPAPPGELPAKEVQKTRAVADAVAELGQQSTPAEVAGHVRGHTDVVISAGEAAVIQGELTERAKPPGDRRPHEEPSPE